MSNSDQISPATGLLLVGGYTVPGVAPGAKATGISTLSLAPDGAVIYTTNEDYAANGAGKSLAFTRPKKSYSGALEPTEKQGALDSGGSGCCHATLDLTGAHVIFSNYMVRCCCSCCCSYCCSC